MQRQLTTMLMQLRPLMHNRQCNATSSPTCALLLALMAMLSIPVGSAPLLAHESDKSRLQDSQPSEHRHDSDETAPIDDIELFELEIPTVVTADRSERKSIDLPHAISVITSEDIRRSGARSVPDALRLATSVDVAELSYGTAAVSVRGLHGLLSREVLVLVDGREIHDPLFGGTPWGAWPFQLEDIERIEVVRGPGSVTWGGNAVNGVINIITKAPKDQIGLTVTGMGGSHGTNKEHIGYAWADDTLQLRVSGEHESSDGNKSAGLGLFPADEEYRAGRIAVHAIAELTPKDTLTFSLGSSAVDGMFAPNPHMGMFDKKNPGAQASYLLAKWEHRIHDDNIFHITSYVNDYGSSTGLQQVDYRYQQMALQIGHTFSPNKDHRITWGIDSRVDLLDASNAHPSLLDDDHITTGIFGLYIQDEWTFAEDWTLNLGGRLDYDYYGGFQPSGRIALSHQLDDNQMLYGALSRAFQMPPAASRHLSMPLLGGAAWITADSDVRAENLIAYELGYRSMLLEDRLQLNANLFWHEYDDMTILGYKLGPPGLLRFDFDNGYDAAIYGFEFDSRYALSKKIALLANYTYQCMHNHGPSSIMQTDYLTPPQNKFMVGMHVSPTEDLHLSSYLYYVDSVKSPSSMNPLVRTTVDPYFRLDLRAEYEFMNDDASFAVGVRNLLDDGRFEGSSTFLDDTEVPRMFYAEMRMTIR